MQLAQATRTLVDLLNTEHGYARIFFEQESYSYELYAYRPTQMADLFERMGGYASVLEALEAARHQLSATHPQSGSKPRAADKSVNRGTRKQSSRSPGRRRSVAGSMGLL